MFKKILIVYSEKLTEKHLSVVERIKNIIKEINNKEIIVVNAIDLTKDHFKNIDLVITAGGDGTFIRSSHYLDKTPILGINSEPEYSEGALTSLNEDELEKINEILKGNYKIIEKIRIKIKRNNIILDEHALNEVYIGSEKQFHTSRYIIKYLNNEEEHRSSGVLITTPQGSSAWYKAAGGKSFYNNEKKLRFIIREPYFGRIFQPKILNGDIIENEKIEVVSKRHEGNVIVIDSHKIYEFNNKDLVEIEISDKPLRVITKL